MKLTVVLGFRVYLQLGCWDTRDVDARVPTQSSFRRAGAGYTASLESSEDTAHLEQKECGSTVVGDSFKRYVVF